MFPGAGKLARKFRNQEKTGLKIFHFFQGPVRMLVPLRPNHATLMQFENQEGCIDSDANIELLQDLTHLLFSKEIGFIM